LGWYDVIFVPAKWDVNHLQELSRPHHPLNTQCSGVSIMRVVEMCHATLNFSSALPAPSGQGWSRHWVYIRTTNTAGVNLQQRINLEPTAGTLVAHSYAGDQYDL